MADYSAGLASPDYMTRVIAYATQKTEAWDIAHGSPRYSEEPATTDPAALAAWQTGHNDAWSQAYSEALVAVAPDKYYGLQATPAQTSVQAYGDLDQLRQAGDVTGQDATGAWLMSPALTVDVRMGIGRAPMVARLKAAGLRFVESSGTFTNGLTVDGAIAANTPATNPPRDQSNPDLVHIYDHLDRVDAVEVQPSVTPATNTHPTASNVTPVSVSPISIGDAATPAGVQTMGAPIPVLPAIHPSLWIIAVVGLALVLHEK